MMEAIVRLNNKSHDAQILINQSGKEIFKDISMDELYKIIGQYRSKKGNSRREHIKLLNPSILAIGNGVTVIRQPEHKRIVLYGNKSYNINFPAAIYFVRHEETRINEIAAYSYFKWQGLDTVLYKYPMPNMLSGDCICMGSADRQIKDGIVPALEQIIYASYTHDSVENTKGFKSTLVYFKYLKNHHLSYTNCIKSTHKLSDMVEA
ncbi:MAG: hypothetical protein LKF48_07420 [Prevotella sp.]|jgi:hypothetical protein|nr:hypothetical protein [Prevotella sp.]MCH4182968.1 hypothetical protein [Prevotella sp.]